MLEFRQTQSCNIETRTKGHCPGLEHETLCSREVLDGSTAVEYVLEVLLTLKGTISTHFHDQSQISNLFHEVGWVAELRISETLLVFFDASVMDVLHVLSRVDVGNGGAVDTARTK